MTKFCDECSGIPKNPKFPVFCNSCHHAFPAVSSLLASHGSPRLTAAATHWWSGCWCSPTASTSWEDYFAFNNFSYNTLKNWFIFFPSFSINFYFVGYRLFLVSLLITYRILKALTRAMFYMYNICIVCVDAYKSISD